MTTRLPVSVCMISGAEAHRIGRALASVAEWAGEIVVVLNQEINDGTEEIARGHGARVFREPWKGHIAQKNSAAAKATQPWLLGLDADEVVSPELGAELAARFAGDEGLSPYAAFQFPRCTVYCGRWIRHGDWYPDRVTRLWRSGKAKWDGINPHDKLAVQGRVGRLKSDLLHYSHESLDRQIAKTIAYSDDFVRHCQTRGRKVHLSDLVVRPLWRFLRAYFFRLGFLDGWQGYCIAWMTAFYTFLRYAKARESQLQLPS